MTRAQLTDKYESIEEAKSAAMNGMPSPCPRLLLFFCFSNLFSFSTYATSVSSFSFFPRFFQGSFYLEFNAQLRCFRFLKVFDIIFETQSVYCRLHSRKHVSLFKEILSLLTTINARDKGE